MVTTLLPPHHDIIEPLSQPLAGSSAAEIRLRAQHLAESQNTVLGSARTAALARHHGQKPTSRRKSLGMRVGGDEDRTRKSHDSRRSFSLDAEEVIRKGVADLMAKGLGRHHHHHNKKDSGGHQDAAKSPGVAPGESGQSPAKHDETDRLPAVPGLVTPRVAYLLVSPPQGLLTNLATLSLPSMPLLSRRRTPSQRKASGPSDERQSQSTSASGSGAGIGEPHVTSATISPAEAKLAENPTLAVYGDADAFLSTRRAREWAARLREMPGSRFRAHEVSTAGHFWREGRTAYVLREMVNAFADELLRGEEASTALETAA